MSSILTNTAAMTALNSLQMTNKNIEMTQARISTGMQVGEASDNAAYWSIATTLRSDNSALSTVQDALGLGASKVDIAYTGMNSAMKVVDEIKTKLVAARESTVDKSKVQSEIEQLQNQLKTISASASIAGNNWLSADTSAAGYSSNEDIVASFDRSVTGAVSVSTVVFDTAGTVLTDTRAARDTVTGLLDRAFGTAGSNTTAVTNGVTAATAGADGVNDSILTLDITVAAVLDSDIDQMISNIDAVFANMTDGASDLGSIKKRIGLQTEFVGNLMDAMDRSIGQLVDADMTEESTRLQALQVQQQLGVQSLSIANGNSQTILSLFRG